MKRKVMITGAAGNIGGKLAAHFGAAGTYDLVLVDRRDGRGIIAADLSVYDEAWARLFEGVDTVVHLAGDPHGKSSWDSVMRLNVRGTQNVLRAARAAKVRRVVFASTNQVMLGYRFRTDVNPVTTDLPPAPLSPYGISKLIGEEIGRAFAEETGISFIALRIGYFQARENRPGPHMKIGEWGQSMWLSNDDMNHAIERAIEVEGVPFAIVNLVSDNPGMRWDLEHTRRTIGYEAKDGAPIILEAGNKADDAAAGALRVRPGTWLDENFTEVEG